MSYKNFLIMFNIKFMDFFLFFSNVWYCVCINCDNNYFVSISCDIYFIYGNKEMFKIKIGINMKLWYVGSCNYGW